MQGQGLTTDSVHCGTCGVIHIFKGTMDSRSTNLEVRRGMMGAFPEADTHPARNLGSMVHGNVLSSKRKIRRCSGGDGGDGGGGGGARTRPRESRYRFTIASAVVCILWRDY